MELRERILQALGTEVVRLTPLGAGATGTVSLVELADGQRVVAKVADNVTGDGLKLEAGMLQLLAERSGLPVPRVIHAAADLLVMEYKRGQHSFNDAAQRDAAAFLAALHGVGSADGRFGLEFDGLIGPLPQPNAWNSSWVDFWREHRVLNAAHLASREDRLSAPIVARLERLAARLSDVIPETPTSSLIHADVWSGNVLAEGGRITAFLDPAAYYAHYEVELAFITMFSTFGEEFFRRYAEIASPIDPAFWKTRRHVYNVYPLLVHVRLFGGGYVGELAATLDMLGF